MKNYIMVLFLLSTPSTINGANVQPEGAEETKIQCYYSSAMNRDKDVVIRISFADKILKKGRTALAVAAYTDILEDPRTKTDLDFKLLAAEGLGNCGVAFKGNAILILMSISRDSRATIEHKNTINSIIAGW